MLARWWRPRARSAPLAHNSPGRRAAKHFEGPQRGGGGATTSTCRAYIWPIISGAARMIGAARIVVGRRPVDGLAQSVCVCVYSACWQVALTGGVAWTTSGRRDTQPSQRGPTNEQNQLTNQFWPSKIGRQLHWSCLFVVWAPLIRPQGPGRGAPLVLSVFSCGLAELGWFGELGERIFFSL